MPRVYPPIDGKTTHPHLAPNVIEATAGFTAGVVSTLAVHPFDVVKTRLQVDQSHSVQVGGSWRVIKNILSNDGLMPGFYRGLTPNLIGNSVSWGLYFMWYGNIKDRLQLYRIRQESHPHLHPQDYFMASGFAGILTAIFTNPIWVIKTRMLSTSAKATGAYTSVAHGCRILYRNEGIRGFYRGLLPSLFGVSHGAIQFMAYEQLKIWRVSRLQNLASRVDDATQILPVATPSPTGTGVIAPPPHARVVELSNWDFLSLSAVSKILAGTFTYPYQVVRARLQVYDANTLYKGAWDLMKQIWRKEGIWGYYKGLGPNIVRVLPSTCVTFVVYENAKIFLPRFYETEMEQHEKKDLEKTKA